MTKDEEIKAAVERARGEPEFMGWPERLLGDLADALEALSAQVEELRAERDEFERSLIAQNEATAAAQSQFVATERRLAEVEAERDHWLNEARQNLKNGQNAVDRADRLESALRAAKDAIWSGCDTISATKAIDAALTASSDPRKDVAREADHG